MKENLLDVLQVSGEELLICSVQHADGQSKQAADGSDRWSRFPAKFKPDVEEAISYHGDWLGVRGWGRSVLLQVLLMRSGDEEGGYFRVNR